MSVMRLIALSLALVFALAACGGNDGTQERAGGSASTATPATTATDESSATEDAPAALARRPEGEEGLHIPPQRAQIVADESDFGRVLFDANGQVIYVFEIDGPRPVELHERRVRHGVASGTHGGAATAGAGATPDCSGRSGATTGTLQVTYDQRPLYFYEHERPGEITCHNVDLHGGLWWVVTPSGDPVS